MSPMDPRLLRPRARKSSTPPGQPTALEGIDFAYFIWAAPTSNGGSPITGYRIYADDVDVTDQGTFDVGNPLLWGPFVGGAATWQVSAVNAVGEGPRSASIVYEIV